MDQESLISISKASHILGVSEAALRQWTDEGKLRAFITPGGHRRYLKADLKKLMSQHTRILGVKDLVIELEDTARLHREIGQASLENTSWFNKLNQESQERLADIGRRLLNLIVKYIAEPSKREETIKLVRDVGYDHGKALADLGLPLVDSVEAFILHRNPIMNATAHLVRRKEAFTGRIVEAISLVAHVMDEALVALVAAHQQCHDGAQEGDTTG